MALRTSWPFLTALCGALLVGIALGWTMARLLWRPPLTQVPDTRPNVAVLRIDGTEDGHLVGSVQGEVRVIVDGKAAAIAPDGPVRIPLSALPRVVTVTVPEGMRFTASRRGTRYYPVASPEAAKILPENRVYFPSEEEAEAAGYKR